MSRKDPAVYRIVCHATGDCYVGSSSYVMSRKSAHFQMLRNDNHENQHLQAAWNKYGGEESFSFEILERCEGEACIEREQYWIDTLKPQYNIRKTAEMSGLPFDRSPEASKKSGLTRKGQIRSPKAIAKSRDGNLGKKLSEEHKEKIRQARLGSKASPETIAKLRESHTGKTPSPETIEKNRQAQLGRKLSDEAREKIRQSKLGKKRSPELREKLRQANLGKKQSPETIQKRTQHPVSEETKQKLRDARRAADETGKSHGGPAKGTTYKKRSL